MTGRVAVLGVGRMGSPIVQHLLAAGHSVVAHNRDESALDGLAVERADSPSAAVASAEVIVTLLPGTPELEEVMADAFYAMRERSLWIDLGSSDPRVVARIASLLKKKRIDTVGAPMAGGVSAARDRSLHFYVGATSEALEVARPVLETLGTIEHIGDTVESGHTAKLLANLLWFGQVVAVAEALLLGQSLGLHPATLRDTLARSAGGSVFIDEYLDKLLDGDYLEDFGIERVVEELDILSSMAEERGVPFELSTVVARLHREALARFGAVKGELLAAKLLEERAGRDLRR